MIRSSPARRRGRPREKLLENTFYEVWKEARHEIAGMRFSPFDHKNEDTVKILKEYARSKLREMDAKRREPPP